MNDVLNRVVNGLTYDGQVLHILINYVLILLTVLPFLRDRDMPTHQRQAEAKPKQFGFSYSAHLLTNEQRSAARSGLKVEPHVSKQEALLFLARALAPGGLAFAKACAAGDAEGSRPLGGVGFVALKWSTLRSTNSVRAALSVPPNGK